MKKTIVGMAMIATAVLAAPALSAQQRSGIVYGASGGLTVPIGWLGDRQGTGFNLQGHATLKPSSTPFALRGDVGLWTTAGKTSTGPGVSINTKGVTWFTLNANVVYNFEGSKDDTFVPYVIGGAGIYSGTQNFGTKLGINAGGGVTMKLSGFDAFAEARLHNVFTDGSTSRIIPLSFGINLKR